MIKAKGLHLGLAAKLLQSHHHLRGLTGRLDGYPRTRLGAPSLILAGLSLAGSKAMK